MKHLGDITKINGAEIPPVDVITFGAPCQDLSVAGKRAGMKHTDMGDDEITRSGLFFEAVRIIKEMRSNVLPGTDQLFRYPRYGIYENVPGAFSSNKGADFQAVLTELVRVADPAAPDVPLPQDGKWTKQGFIWDEMGKWSIAWRLVDAQFFGTPQRRKRVCVLADFDGLTAGQILFDPQFERTSEDGKPISTVGHTGDSAERTVSAVTESLSWNSEPGGTPGKGTSERTEGSVDASGKCLNGFDVQSKHIQPEDGIAESLYSGECRYGGGESYCLQGNVIDRDVKQGGAGVCADVSYTLDSVDRHGVFSAGFKGGQSADARPLGYEEEKAPALTSEPPALEPTAVVIPINTMVGTRTTDEKRTTFGVGDDGDPQFTISAAHEHAVCYAKTTRPHLAEEAPTIEMTETAPTLNAFDSGETRANVFAVDMYNGSVTGETAVTLNANTGTSANHAWPSVLSFTNRGYDKVNEDEVSDSLRAECHGAQPCILENGS